MWYLIVSIPDLCPPSYFVVKNKSKCFDPELARSWFAQANSRSVLQGTPVNRFDGHSLVIVYNGLRFFQSTLGRLKSPGNQTVIVEDVWLTKVEYLISSSKHACL